MHCVGNEVILFLILTALHVHCRNVLKTHNRNETDILLSLKRDTRIEKCDKDIDCDNGGECNTETGRCDCIPGTSGVNCATIENCAQLNCEEKKATCIFDIMEGQPTCKCNDDNFYYEEENCNNRRCISNLCKNGGSCLGDANEEGGFKCICKEMWKGETCEEACYCANGKCVEENGKQLCECNPGFGNYSEEECRACNCGPDSNCIFRYNIFGKVKVCLCKPGFHEKNGKCVACYCANGKCFVEDGKQLCKCNPGFGNYSEEECRACNCGPDSNCVFQYNRYGKSKICLCKPGFHDKNGKCVGKSCSAESECEYPFKCLDQGDGEEKFCALESCAIGDNCEYPLECVDLGDRGGKVCKRKLCSEESDCKYPLTCVDLGDRYGKKCAYESCTEENDYCKFPLKCIAKGNGEHVCARQNCTVNDDCEYPLKCVDYGDGDGRVCTGTKCTIDDECPYPLRCIDNDNGEGYACARDSCSLVDDCRYPLECIEGDCIRKHCYNNDDCQYPLKCEYRKDERRKVCTRKQCTSDEDCAYPLNCVYNGYNEGKVCARKQCNNDSDCQYPLKCTGRGYWHGKVCSECDCGPFGFCNFKGVPARKTCTCAPFTLEVEGKCIECDCGPLGSCSFESGQKKCVCSPDSIEKDGKCIECNCGVNAHSCFFRRNGIKVCDCEFGYIQINGHCSAICSEDKCVHGKCEISGNGFKCRCNDGFTGGRCEEKIQVKLNKQDLFPILQLSVALATFILLSGVLCFLSRIVNQISKK